jgi:hypothetical protein
MMNERKKKSLVLDRQRIYALVQGAAGNKHPHLHPSDPGYACGSQSGSTNCGNNIDVNNNLANKQA